MTEIRKIRREVMTLANQLVKKLNSLSAALKRAWQLVKAKRMFCKVSGVTFGNRQTALKRLEMHIRKGAEVKTTLQREADNKTDKNAIKVLVSVNGSAAYHLGYIPAELAAVLAPLMDKIGEIKAHLYNIVGGYDTRSTYGARLALYL
ncbi:HIRAN domain-containing protein [bacterium]|nr:HIRAN domain-containing protein [bacterium]